jgi:hypothetical protein
MYILQQTINEVILNSDAHNRLLSTHQKSEWPEPYPDMCWVDAARASGEKTVAARLQPLQCREGLKEDFI